MDGYQKVQEKHGAKREGIVLQKEGPAYRVGWDDNTDSIVDPNSLKKLGKTTQEERLSHANEKVRIKAKTDHDKKVMGAPTMSPPPVGTAPAR